MKLSEKKTGDFSPHPETDSPVRTVIVDVTPLKKRQTEFGEKEEFKLVFESETKDDDGKHFCIWSRGYTPSLNPKAAFRKDLKKLLGRDLTAQELEEFDTESLIGLGAKLMIEHSVSGDTTYANIAMMRPDEKPLTPSGKFVRAKDREQKTDAGTGGGSSSTYKKAADTEEVRQPWQKTKVHVGKHKGVDLGDLDQDAVTALIEKWLPAHKANEKPTADDKRLGAALEEVNALLTGDSAPAEEAAPAEAEY
jgi:hypothetical protein